MIFNFAALFLISLLSLTETVIYPGFCQARLKLPFTAFIILYLLFFVYRQKYDHRLPKKISLVFKIASVSGLLLSAALFFFEYRYYPNYSFSHYHLDPKSLGILSGIIFLFASPKVLKNNYFSVFALSLLIIFSLANLPAVLGQSVASLSKVYSERGLSYGQKMSLKIGPDYDFFQFINHTVKESESLTLPPWQLPWRHTGDLNYVRGFIFPRIIVNGSLETANIDTDYVVLTSETEDGYTADNSLWPNYPVKAQSVIIFNFADHSSQIYYQNYDPKDWRGKSPWGLIKIR